MSGTRRPRSLLSGLIFCGCCGGSYALRGSDRFACSADVGKGTCSNGRTIPREELESRVLAGLKDRMMSPEVAAEAMRAYAEETNRLNRGAADQQRCLEGRAREDREADRPDRRSDRRRHVPPVHEGQDDGLEARKAELTALLSDVPHDVPDLLPTASKV